MDEEKKSQDKEREIAQLRHLIELEEKLGSIVPGGAQGGVAAKLRRAAEYDLCVCGGPKKAKCPWCLKMVRVEGGKFVAHERGICTGSHMEYKSCPKSGKPVDSGGAR